jgi:hypothetical protein
MRRLVWAGVGCVGVIFALATYNVLASNVLHGKVTARSLYVAVENEAGVDALFRDEHGRCSRTVRPRVWECMLSGVGGSTGVTYTVRIRRDNSCWDGHGGGVGFPARINGCVHLQE